MNVRGLRIVTMLMAVVLTARLGTIQYGNHKETWYNLRMNKVVERADAFYGLHDVYAVREDGVKTYNGFVIVATDWSVYPFGSVVETSLGTGIVLDHHTAKDKTLVDVATAWGKGGNK